MNLADPALLPPTEDWLIRPPTVEARALVTADGETLVLANGLVRRDIRLKPGVATVGLTNLSSGEALIRAASPEGTITLDGKTFGIGGLLGQPNRAYLLPEWLAALRSDPNAFRFDGIEIGEPKAPFPWKRKRSAPPAAWPPKGVSVSLRFTAPPGLDPGTRLTVHYELYNGIPAMAKWVTLENRTGRKLRLNRISIERLAAVEGESAVDQNPWWRLPNVLNLSNYMFGGMGLRGANKGARWVEDPEYTTQVNYELKTPCILDGSIPMGPEIDVAPGDTFESHRLIEIFPDGDDRERQGLTIRKVYRTLAPWTLENPLMFHLRSTDSATVRAGIDQAAEVGFDVVILSFGSGLNMEDIREENLAKFKALVDYAHSKGVELGGYSLLASRRISDEHDVIDPATGKPGKAIFGNSPCLGSAWGIDYFRRIKIFLERTGFDLLEHDGNYPGDVCASTSHPGHRGLEDSQWTQWRQIADLYAWCRERGIYLNVPDHYYFAGSNKSGMGYRETNWSLPRPQQHIHARQNLFDGTWEKTPSMGWMFVPLVEYHGGGPEATIEPLDTHLADYERHLANNLGYGAQACYRGVRLYDTPRVRDAVKRWTTWFQQHREILESDLIHVRRPDGQRLDVALHANPSLRIRAMAVIYNPAPTEQAEELLLPLYYAGLRGRCRVAIDDRAFVGRRLDGEHRLKIRVKVPPGGVTWVRVAP